MKSFAFVAVALAVDLARRSAPWRALTVALAYGLSMLASTALKDVVRRPRPSGEHLVPLPHSWSFPSGHATSAFAAAVALGLLVPRARWPALVLAALIAYSRVYLGVHYWTDVLAGAALGALVGWLVARAVLKNLSRNPSWS